jgi:hypothetical protein
VKIPLSFNRLIIELQLWASIQVFEGEYTTIFLLGFPKEDIIQVDPQGQFKPFIFVNINLGFCD